MKEFVKFVVPPQVFRWTSDRYWSFRLAGLKPESFNVGQLASRQTIGIKAIFAASALLEAWKRDHAAISELYGENEHYGAVNPGDRRALYYLVRALKPQRVLEVGTHVGASTLYIAKALIANGSGTISTVDIRDVNSPEAWWSKVGLPLPPRGLAERLGCSGEIRFVVAPALDYMRSTAEKFDMIFLDGNHRAPDVYQEMAVSLDILRPEGLILLHDFYPNGTALFPDDNVITGPYRALQRIARENPRIAVMPLGELPWPTKNGSQMTSLALIARE